ncbi:MAG: DegT/DnrJ/EryC1/StrS aminotransferase family protein [Pseudomonadota bacterium]
MGYKVPLASLRLAEAELVAVMDVLKSTMVSQGRAVADFEAALAEQVGVSHAVMVNSGTSANMIALEAVAHLSRMRPDALPRSLDRGDEAIIQGLCWPTTLTPLLNQGLVPVFCDIDPITLNAGVAQIAAARTARTKMVIAVPVLGNPGHLEQVKAYCEAEGLIFVEDSCESMGAITEQGHQVGSLGLTAAFSFFISHHITTIEGGAVLTDDPLLAQIARALRAHGWSRELDREQIPFEIPDGIDPRFHFLLPGYNVRSTNLNAAIGLEQLKRHPGWLDDRRRLASGRIAALADLVDKVIIPGVECADRHSWMAFPMRLPDRQSRDRMVAALEEAGVETRPVISGNILRHPLVDTLPLAEHQAVLPECDAISQTGLMIGMDPDMDDDREAYLHQALRDALEA